MTPCPSGTCAIPALTICSGLRPARSAPPSRTRPRRGLIMPLIARSSVVLPAPFAPSTAVMAAVPAEMLTPSSAMTPPYPAVSPSTASAGDPSCWAAALLISGHLLRPALGRRRLIVEGA